MRVLALNTLLSISGSKLTLKKQPFPVWQQQSEVALRLVMNAVSSNAAVGTLQLPFVTGRWLPKPGCNLLLMLSRVSTTATVAERSSLAMETWNHSIDLATRLRLRFGARRGRSTEKGRACISAKRCEVEE